MNMQQRTPIHPIRLAAHNYYWRTGHDALMGRVAPAGRPPSTIVPTSPDRKEEDQKKTTGCVWPPYQTTRPPSSEVVAVVRRCARRSFICRIEIVVIDGGLVAGRLAVAADRSRRQSAQSRRQRTDHLGKRRGLLLPAPPFPRRWLSFVRYLSPALYTAMHACTHAEAQRPARVLGRRGPPAGRPPAAQQRRRGRRGSIGRGGLGFAARESEGCQSRQTPSPALLLPCAAAAGESGTARKEPTRGSSLMDGSWISQLSPPARGSHALGEIDRRGDTRRPAAPAKL